MHYFESSALVKVFVRELGSDVVDALLAELEAAQRPATTSRLSFPEVAAGICRAVRQKRLSGRALERYMEALRTQEIGPLVTEELTDQVCDRAVCLARKHPLKGADAVHLASALQVGADVFVCSDFDLLTAAAAEGLTCIDPTAPPDEPPET